MQILIYSFIKILNNLSCKRSYRIIFYFKKNEKYIRIFKFLKLANTCFLFAKEEIKEHKLHSSSQ